MLSQEERHREPYVPGGPKHKAFELLSEVFFNNLPVVPIILATDETGFWTEQLCGIAWYDFYMDKEREFTTKLEVLLSIVKQLQAVDDAGYVIFDRNGDNIWILSDGSVRQLDPEDFFIVDRNLLLTEREWAVDRLGLDFLLSTEGGAWSWSVDQLAFQATSFIKSEMLALSNDDSYIKDKLVKMYVWFDDCIWRKGGPSHTLEELEEVCTKSLELLKESEV